MSIPEGEDKPLKYPLVFHNSHLLLINKCDLTGILDFDIKKLKENARKINPKLDIIELSAKTGNGIEKWLEWLKKTGHKIIKGGKHG